MTATIKRTISAAVFLLMVLQVTCPYAYASEQTNLLRNPSFEEAGTWKASKADVNDIVDARNASNPRTGKYSAYTRATTINGDGYALVHQNVSIPVDRALEFSFWLYVKRHDLPLYGYVKGFIVTATGRYFDVGIWSELPAPKPNEYRVQAKLENYDSWIRISTKLGKLWIDEAEFPKNDTIISVSLGIYNGLVYALPKNLLYLEVYFDDVFLGPNTVEDEPRFPWLLTASVIISVSMVTAALLWRRRHPHLPPEYKESVPRKQFNRGLKDPGGDSNIPFTPARFLCGQTKRLGTRLGRRPLTTNDPDGGGPLV